RVRVLHVEGGGIGDAPAVGARMSVRATVDLGGLAPSDVVVQAVYGRVDEHDVLHRPVAVALSGGEVGEDGFPGDEGGVASGGAVLKSALFLTVPEAEPLLDAVRGLPGVALLEPAHISIGYPWVPDPSVDRVLEAAAQVKPHVVELRGPELFVQDVRQRTVVHGLLSDETVPRRLAELLDAPLRTPHLSIARVRKSGDVGQVVDAVAHLLPLRVRLEFLELT